MLIYRYIRLPFVAALFFSLNLNLYLNKLSQDKIKLLKNNW